MVKFCFFVCGVTVERDRIEMSSEIREKTIVVEEEAPAVMQSSSLSSSGGSRISTAEEEEAAASKRKLVFISLRAYSDGARKDLVSDGKSYYTTTRDGDGDGDGDGDYNLPAEHQAYGVVNLEQQHELFFIGGYTFPRDFKKEVWIYNFQTDCWYQGPPMNRPRDNPTVLAHKNNIYVFGGSNSSPCFPEMNVLTPSDFVEFYDSAANAWFYQPSQPPEEIIKDSSITSHALDEAHGVVYSWTVPHGVYSYHLQSRSWSSFKLQGPPRTFHPCKGLLWSNTTVFLHSCVIWSYFGTIYAYRVTDHLFLSLFTLPEPFITVFGSPMDLGFESSPTYLVNVGDNKLCLVYGNLHNHDSEIIRCHTFEVRDSPIPLKFTLEHKGCHVCHCGEDFTIESVHAVNLDDVHMMKKKVLDVSRTLPIECDDDLFERAQEAIKRLDMLSEGLFNTSTENESHEAPYPPHQEYFLQEKFIATLSPIPPHSLSEQVNFINNLTQRIKFSGNV